MAAIRSAVEVSFFANFKACVVIQPYKKENVKTWWLSHSLLYNVVVLCFLSRVLEGEVYLVELVAELFVCVGKVCDGLACMEHGCVVSFADVLSYLGC